MKGYGKLLNFKSKAVQLILMFGLISLFGDILYEGARSVNGPYLKTLGANAAIVGLIAGVGEFIGYGIRLLSGYFSDKTKAYWLFTFIGYGMLASVPLLALAGIWQVAGVFILAERLGKALRAPARDTIVSQATKEVGTGIGFGFSEMLDQIGALTGPMIFTVFFMITGGAIKNIVDYQKAYSLFWLPFILLMICIAVAYIKVPEPEKLEKAVSKKRLPEKLSRTFWLYTLFSFLTTAGLVNFILMAYHFKTRGLLTDVQIPLFYGLGMGIDAIAALIIGHAYDELKHKHKKDLAGLLTLVIIPLLSGIMVVFAFTSGTVMAMISIMLWGVIMGAHETVMKSAIADLTPIKKRGTGYGIFNASYGLAMFIGGAVMGLLYEISIPLLVISAIILEVSSIPVFIMMKEEALKSEGA